MRQLLIVSPNFPPVNAADMHRVRMSLPYFEEFGWRPHVLAVDAESNGECVMDPDLLASLPPGIGVTRVKGLPLSWTRPVGIGNVALRAWPHLYAAGARLLRETRFDLVFFSTTMFASMPMGRLWKRRFGVPYVLDMQDPWHSDYQPADRVDGKGRLARALHATLEPFTMRAADGVIAVSPAYSETLQRRYRAITAEKCVTIPFGGSERDLELARQGRWTNPFFTPGNGLHGAYVGRGGTDMRVAADILFRAVAAATTSSNMPGVDFSFIGTDYAPVATQRKSIEPAATAAGVGDIVREWPSRVPYFDGLRVLLDADVLIVLGSDDAQYSPSKIYPYLLARKPIVAVLHAASPVVELMRGANAGIVVTFRGAEDVESAARALAAEWPALVARLPCDATTDLAVLAPFSARELTRRQCAMFDAVVEARAAA